MRGFGHAVAVHGDTIVVGAYQEDHIIDPNDNTKDKGDAGAAYVFTKPATGWADMTETARLIASDAVANDEFGTSVAVHGDTIVVGSPEKDVNTNDGTDDAKGSAYIFTRPADGWSKWSTLADDGKAGLTATLERPVGCRPVRPFRRPAWRHSRRGSVRRKQCKRCGLHIHQVRRHRRLGRLG